MGTRLGIPVLVVLLAGVAHGRAAQMLMVERPDLVPPMAVPMEMPPTGDMPADRLLYAQAESGGETIALQNCPSLFFSPNGAEMARTYCTVLPAELTSGRLRVSVGRIGGGRFSIAERGDRMQVSEGRDAVFVYRHQMQLASDVPEKYRRSTYIHPLFDLHGVAITDDFPKDHYHHRGLSWMWPYVRIGERVYDLWAIEGIRQVFEGWLVRETGPVCATLGIKNGWHTDERKVMEEWVWIRTFPVTGCGRAIDFLLTWKALEPVELRGRADHDKGYGGFCLRYGPRETTVITTPDGVEQGDSDRKPFAWADESAKFRGASVFSGAAVFQHATNPNFPAGWCLRHYGFVGVSWPALESFTLQPGRPLSLRFRVWVHDGDAKQGRVAEAYRLFAEPPALSFAK